jgi:predicted nuclease of predicted toxin-antitoxin system
VIKLLIDECLTPDLVDIARARWIEAAHVSRIGYTSAADWALVEFALQADFAFVTNNARDFRRLYKRVELHPGLLIIVPQGRYELQISLFRKILDHIESHPDTVNRLIEIDESGRVTVTPWSKVNL